LGGATFLTFHHLETPTLYVDQHECMHPIGHVGGATFITFPTAEIPALGLDQTECMRPFGHVGGATFLTFTTWDSDKNENQKGRVCCGPDGNNRADLQCSRAPRRRQRL